MGILMSRSGTVTVAHPLTNLQYLTKTYTYPQSTYSHHARPTNLWAKGHHLEAILQAVPFIREPSYSFPFFRV